MYCNFLDAKSAFDSVWHDGLFVKLFRLGVNVKMWILLRSTYNRMYAIAAYATTGSCHSGSNLTNPYDKEEYYLHGYMSCTLMI